LRDSVNGYRRVMVDEELAPLLGEQKDYYRALAPEYLDGALDLPGGDDLVVALDAFAPAGDVLELACGPGSWTPQLLRYATSVTAVDSSLEMLALARERVGGDDRVDFVCADLFVWRPERRYGVVFFGFWLSHVPRELFAAFWALVADCLTPDGRVFFVDDAHRTPDELINGEDSAIIRRRLRDGTTYRAVKIPYTPTGLQQRLAGLGWNIGVHGTAGPFYWGTGARA
jgi:SAM-dependent methyltransferase